MTTRTLRHTHRAETIETRPFFGPVSDRQNPRAHGGVTLHRTCRCGAVQLINSNGGATERGPWCAPANETEDV